MHTIVLKHSKSTKGTHVYEAQPGSPPVVKTLYVEKWALGEPVPDHIEITLKAAAGGK